MNVAHSQPGGSTIYNAQIVAGSLMIPESRKIARLMLENPDEKAWNKAIVLDNILQKKNPATSKRQAHLIRNRLVLMSEELWRLIVEASPDTALQAIFAASIKQSRLVGDFMDRTVRDRWQTFKRHLSDKDWHEHMEMCAQIDSVVTQWSETTQNKLRQVALRMLAEAKYLDGTQAMQILPVAVLPEVKSYLVDNQEQYVLRCMEVTQ